MRILVADDQPGIRKRVCLTLASLVNLDVCDEAAVAKALDGVEAVIHLAAIVGYPACKKEPHVAQTTNVEGTRTLLRLRKPDQKIVFASTGSIYGSVPDYVCSENTHRAPIEAHRSVPSQNREPCCATALPCSPEGRATAPSSR